MMRSIVAYGALGGTLVLLLLRHRNRRQRRDRLLASSQVYVLNGEYYQLLGTAWDHEVKDFKVVYRPLYHCTAKEGRFEAHTLAVSHFSRWESKFKRVTDPAMMPAATADLLLPGPFAFDPLWGCSTAATPYLCCGPNRSGLGTRSHELPPGVTLLHENERLRIFDVRIKADAVPIRVVHAHPTVRWQVDEAGLPTPQPRFFTQGEVACLPEPRSSHAPYREIVFEILSAPVLEPEQVAELLSSSPVSSEVGSSLRLDNAYCRCWDFQMPMGGGDRTAFHLHRLPYAFVCIGRAKLNVYRPSRRGGSPACSPEWCCHLEKPDGGVVWSPITNGGMEADGITPRTPGALHSVDNALADEPFREYMIELK